MSVRWSEFECGIEGGLGGFGIRFEEEPADEDVGVDGRVLLEGCAGEPERLVIRTAAEGFERRVEETGRCGR